MQISNGVNPEETIYISLEEATKFCNYSQEYLSLRARQGKLRALKFGRNWVTKKEWLEEYLKTVEEYNNNLKVKKFVAPPENLPIEEALKPVSQFWKLKIRFGFVVVLVFVLLTSGIVFGKDSFKNVFEMADPVVKEISQAFNAEEIEKSFKVVYQDLDPYVIKISQATDLAAKEIFEDAKDFYSGIGLTLTRINRDFGEGINRGVQIVGGAGDIVVGTPTKIIFETVSEIPQSFRFVSGEISSQLLTVSSQTAGIGETVSESLKGYFQWLGQGYLTVNDTLEKNLSQDVDNLVTGVKWLNSKFQKMVLAARDWTWQKWQFVIRPWREVPLVEEPLRPKPEEGAIVVPSPPEAKLAEVKGKLEKAFSDRVEVKPDVTGRAGIIKPLIKEAEAQEYLYLIVPVSENE